jgi:hypothetical protein
MTLGVAPKQADLFPSTAAYCDGRVAPGSIYGILHRECFRLPACRAHRSLTGRPRLIFHTP